MYQVQIQYQHKKQKQRNKKTIFEQKCERIAHIY